MSKAERVLLCVGVFLVDTVFFFLPLTAIFITYILFWNPPWFREFLAGLDKAKGT